MATARNVPSFLSIYNLFIVFLLGLYSCGSPNRWREEPDSSNDSGIHVTEDDADGDGIGDIFEEREDRIDTDGDNTPDYLDLDSDNDYIPDAIEGGTRGDDSRTPVDSDTDGTPDFRDLDSDNNGIFDQVEGGYDSDGNGIPNSADDDNDGDTIPDVTEIGNNPSLPTDTDDDGEPDYIDRDSDGDTIADVHESWSDTDGDGIPNYRDLDSDNDNFSDADEAGDDDILTPPVDSDGDSIPDYRDPDSDNDGLSDRAEAEAGTDPTDADSDDDDVTDLVEVAAGTDPRNPDHNPRTRGDLVFLIPYNEDPDPRLETVSFSTSLRYADVYFLMDTTGSMWDAIEGLQDTLSETIIPRIEAWIGNVMVGVGRFDDYPVSPYGSVYSGDTPFLNLQILTDDISLAQTAVNSMSAIGGGDLAESHVPALYAVATGCAMSGDGSIASDGSCTNPSLIGYPHFRRHALPIIVLFTDAPFHNGPGGANPYSSSTLGFSAATYDRTVEALRDIEARVIGVSSDSRARPHLEQLARDTNTVDSANTPLVYNQEGDFGSLVTDAILSVSEDVPLDIEVRAIDDWTDSIDTMAFIDDIVPVYAPVTSECAAMLTIENDSFIDVLPGTTVCFDVTASRNTTVEPTTEPQMFMATFQIWGDGATLLDERDVYFLVPPVIEDPGDVD